MKKNFFWLLCLIFGSSYAQRSELSTTQTQINQELSKARELSTSDIRKAMEISTEVYAHSKSIGYKQGMLGSSILLMAKYFDMGNFKQVIELGQEAEKLAKQTRDDEALANAYRLRASSYTELGFNEESFREFKKALHVTEGLSSKNDKYYQRSLIFIGLANHSAHTNAPVDSVIYYQRKSLETINKVDNSSDYAVKKNHTLALTYMNLGMTSNASKKTKEAEGYFSKALEICKRGNLNKNLEVTILNEFAWLYHDQNKYSESKDYAERAEALEKQVAAPYIRRDIYEVLFKSYVELGEKETSKKYMHLYTKLNDSLVKVEKITINTPLKQMMGKKDEINNHYVQKIVMASSGIFVILILSGWFLWRRHQNSLHQRYSVYISSIKEKAEKDLESANLKENNKAPSEKRINITDSTTFAILQRLDEFETSQQFIRNDISLTYIANSLNTNTRYLSEVIKQHKGKNFSNYVNGLRINYLTELLYNDPKYREYKISYLAEVCGFGSREFFATVFKKETGVTPSYFISKLTDQEKS